MGEGAGSLILSWGLDELECVWDEEAIDLKTYIYVFHQRKRKNVLMPLGKYSKKRSISAYL